MFYQPDHVIAEKPRRDRRKLCRHVDPAFGDQRAQSVERMALQSLERIGIEARLTVDPAFGAAAIPDQIGLHADYGIAPADLAAGHRFKHEVVFARARQLQRDGRIEIGGQLQIQNLFLARGPTGFEFLEGRGQFHVHPLS